MSFVLQYQPLVSVFCLCPSFRGSESGERALALLWTSRSCQMTNALGISPWHLFCLCCHEPVFPFVPCNIIGNISSIWPWPKGLSHSIMILPEIIIVKWLNILINRAAIYTWVGCALRDAKRSILILIYVNNFKNNSICVCN